VSGTEAVAGDGVLSIPAKGDIAMSGEGLDIPEGVGKIALSNLATDFQAGASRRNAVADAAIGALQGNIVENFKNTDATSSRAVSGILATPIAGPTNKQV
jgi:hypothetical protein